MTRKQLDNHLSIVKDYMRKLREFEIGLSKGLEDVPIVTVGDILLYDYIKLVSELAGDSLGWIDWYVWENDFGKKKLEENVDNH